MNKKSLLLFPALYSVIFFVIWGYTITLMSGIYIIGDLGGNQYMSTYPVSFYAVGNTIGIPLGKPLAKSGGVVRCLICCLLFFALFSLLSAFSPNFLFFNGMRFLQGVASGPFYIFVNQLLSDLVPREKKALSTTIMLTIMTVVPAFGASWGGVVAYAYDWRWIFYIDLPALLIIVVILQRNLKGYQPPLSYEKGFNWIGYIFYSLSIFTISFALTTGQEFDWFRSPLINTFTFIGITSLLFYLFYDYRHPHPVMDLKLFKHPIFCFSLINLALLFSAYFGMVILLSLWLHFYADYTPTWIALLIGTMAVAGLLPKFLLEKNQRFNDCRLHLAIALILLAISSFHTAYFNADVNFGRIAFSRILAGFGLAFFLPPIFRLAFHVFTEERVVDILVPFQLVRALSSVLGGPLYVILWQRRQVFYHERLGEQLTAFSQVTQDYFEKAKNFLLQGLPADAQLEHYLNRQASYLALDDCFYFMGWVFVALMILLLATLALRKSAFCPETCTLEESKKPLFKEGY